MELVISKQSMMSTSECVNYPIPEGTWAKFKFECCYADGRATISKNGTTKAQLSMSNDEVVIQESGTFAVCVLGRNTKSSVYVTLIHEADRGNVIVAAGTNVTVDKSQSGKNTTYTVNAKDDDSKTVITAGQNITVSSSKSGDTTTWTINGTEQGSHTEVRAGSNITVTSGTEGNKTIYTVSGAEQGSHTEVRAGTNTSVTSSTEGNKTIYTVSATVPTPTEQRVYDVTSTTPDTLTVSKVTSGNTTTFNLAATGGGTGTDVEITSTDSNLIITKV